MCAQGAIADATTALELASQKNMATTCRDRCLCLACLALRLDGRITLAYASRGLLLRVRLASMS